MTWMMDGGMSYVPPSCPHPLASLRGSTESTTPDKLYLGDIISVGLATSALNAGALVHPRRPTCWLNKVVWSVSLLFRCTLRRVCRVDFVPNIWAVSVLIPTAMPPPIVTITFQSALITLCSCLIALYLTPDEPPHIPSLLLYCLLSTPPNFLYQKYIESKFPGYTLQKVEVDDGGKGVEVEKKLNVRNTCIKMSLDQTLAALINVMAYIGGTRLLKGVPPGLCWEAVKEVCIIDHDPSDSRLMPRV